MRREGGISSKRLREMPVPITTCKFIDRLVMHKESIKFISRTKEFGSIEKHLKIVTEPAKTPCLGEFAIEELVKQLNESKVHLELT